MPSGHRSMARRTRLFFAQAQAALTHYQQFQQVQVQDGSGVLVFSGYIAAPEEDKPGCQNALDTQIVCMDQHFLADKRVVATLYRNQTFGYIVNDMLSTILSQEGVPVGQIAAGPIIPIANFGYVSVSAAMDALVAAASSSGVQYYWMIDQNLLLWAVPYTAVVGPAVDGTQVDDGRASGFKPKVIRANPKYRKTQYAVGGVAQTTVQTEIHVGDGNTQSFPMGFDLASAPTITINIGAGYVSQTVGLKGQTGYQCDWAAGDKVVTQDSSGVKLRGTPNNDLLKVVYTGQFSTVFSANNADEITAQALLDGTSGKIEAVLTDNTIATSSDWLAECHHALTQYS